MAGYRVHLACSSLLGAGYGALGMLQGPFDWGPAFLGAGLTALGGLLPDLDSDSGVPVRELFGIAAFLAPLLMYGRLVQEQLSAEQRIVLLAGVYLAILRLPQLDDLWTTAYGRVLLVKIGLVALAFAWGGLHKLRAVPVVERGGVLQRLRASIAGESMVSNNRSVEGLRHRSPP